MEDQPGPLPPQGGRLTVIFLVVVGVAVIAAAILATRGNTNGATESTTAAFFGPTAGTTAADFSVDLFDGGTFALSDHLATDGRPVILNFWASWCPPCRAEMPDFDRFAQAREDVLVIGIAVDDSPDLAEEFAFEIGVGYPLGADRTGTIAASYPYTGLPTTWLIGTDGTIIRQQSGMLSFDVLASWVDEYGTAG